MLGARGAFTDMDFETRNLYRAAIEQMARGSKISELEIAGRAMDAARGAIAAHETDDDDDHQDGHHQRK